MVSIVVLCMERHSNWSSQLHDISGRYFVNRCRLHEIVLFVFSSCLSSSSSCMLKLMAKASLSCSCMYNKHRVYYLYKLVYILFFFIVTNEVS